MTITRSILFLSLTLITLSFIPQAAAFGAGNIPSFSYLEDKAFRHGDIEDVLASVFKTASGGFLARGTKFSSLDVKRVYFGNWLRDYSQAVDVGALKKTNLQTILNVIMVLGFLAHGYATAEFETTKERVGCYLPIEHIDNPSGYAEGEDARTYDPRLRGPVDPRELEIDPQTGMKNYIANENGTWDTSKALVRRTIIQCIEIGRSFKRSGNKNDQYEAFRLLGQALHTLEDFTAHSNWCELALISFGYQNVFPHVGRNVRIRTPQGKDVYPLVTGTFGGADFIHSLMGEATDHLSQSSVSDLSKQVTNARSISEGQSSSAKALRQLLFDIPGFESHELTRDMESIQGMRAGQPGGMDPNNMTPQEMHKILWQILSFRDSVMKAIEHTIERIPGLSSLVDKISNSVSVFILTTLEPFIKPLIGTATSALGQSSQAVIDSHDQYEVWNDWNASDPTHSFLSKDHFVLILNEPAGLVAQVITRYTVERIVKAWDDPSIPPMQVTEDVLQCLFHPEFFDNQSQIQRMMLDRMRAWLDSEGGNKNEIINRLSAENVRAGKNKRIGDHSESTGHVHNSMLPEGGLQAVLAQHNVHVPGAGILNAGQDLLSGKMPWSQGFGQGGQHAWREMETVTNPSGGPTSSTSTYDSMTHTYTQSPAPNHTSFTPQHHGGSQGGKMDYGVGGGGYGYQFPQESHASPYQHLGYVPPPQQYSAHSLQEGFSQQGHSQQGYSQQGYRSNQEQQVYNSVPPQQPYRPLPGQGYAPPYPPQNRYGGPQ